MEKTTAGAPWPRTVRCLVLLAAVFGGCAGRDGGTERAPEPATSAALRPGEDVTLRGPVTSTYGAYVFAIGSGSSRAVVVVVPAPAVIVGRQVEVTGRVRTFRRRELEAELGVDLGPDVGPLEDGVCLVAMGARVR